MQCIIKLNSSGLIWWCCSFQFFVQTVHHKQEVGFKHCKMNICFRGKFTFSKTWSASKAVTHINKFDCLTFYDKEYCRYVLMKSFGMHHFKY